MISKLFFYIHICNKVNLLIKKQIAFIFALNWKLSQFKLNILCQNYFQKGTVFIEDYLVAVGTIGGACTACFKWPSQGSTLTLYTNIPFLANLSHSITIQTSIGRLFVLRTSFMPFNHPCPPRHQALASNNRTWWWRMNLIKKIMSDPLKKWNYRYLSD